jgi:hypothetical protein
MTVPINVVLLNYKKPCLQRGLGIGHWALGIGHWGLGIDYLFTLSPVPSTKTPILLQLATLKLGNPGRDPLKFLGKTSYG